MHYKGMLRVARRENGIRIYATQQHGDAPAGAAVRRAQVDALVDMVVGLYAPIPAASLTYIVRRLRYAAPHWDRDITKALQRARARLSHATIDGHKWYWPADEETSPDEVDGVRLLAPFDPVRDRRRFEMLWTGRPVRSLHAGAETKARILRAAAVVARSRDRLDQHCQGRQRHQR